MRQCLSVCPSVRLSLLARWLEKLWADFADISRKGSSWPIIMTSVVIRSLLWTADHNPRLFTTSKQWQTAAYLWIQGSWIRCPPSSLRSLGGGTILGEGACCPGANIPRWLLPGSGQWTTDDTGAYKLTSVTRYQTTYKSISFTINVQ